MQVWIHSNCCKGVISLVGKGGAIRVQRGSALLTDCYFEDNTASLLGGAIFVDLLGRLTMDNVTLVITRDDVTLQGWTMDNVTLVGGGNTASLW